MRVSLFRRAAPDPATISVTHEGERFDVAIKRRSTARRLTLRISHATGSAVLTLPPRSSIETARRFVDGHGAWIATRLRGLPRPVAFEPGVAIPLRDAPHRIVRWSG